MFPHLLAPPHARSTLLMALLLLEMLPTGQAASPQPKLILTLGDHQACIFKVAYSPDGKQLATTSVDETVRLWDAATGRSLHVLRGHKGEVYGAAFSPDGRLLVSAGSDGKVCLWDVAGGKLVRTLDGPGNDLFAVAFSPDGQTVAAGSLEGRIRLWSVKQGRVLHTLAGHANRVCGLAFSSNGERLVSACGIEDEAGSGERGGEVKVWDVVSGDPLLTIPGRKIGILTVAFSPDGKRLAGACLDKTVRVWEAATGAEVLVLKGHKQEVYSVAVSPDGRWLASCGGSWNLNGPGEIKVWDLATGRQVVNIKGHATPVWSVAFRLVPRGGLHLASASGRWRKDEQRKSEPDEVKVWDLTALSAGGLPPVSERQQETLWADLGDRDAAKAYRAVWSLSASPKVALALLKKHLRPPIPSTDYARIARLVADLDNDAFPTREKASAELLRIGIPARPLLRQAQKSPSAEVRRRATTLLQRLKNQPEPPPSMEELRALRAIEVLQHLGGAEVRPLLEKLARGTPGSLVAREAAWVLAQKKSGP